MKTLFFSLVFLPLLAFGQKDYCKQIERQTKNDGTAFYQTPKLRNFTLIKETVPAAFFLMIHFEVSYAEEVGYGVELYLDDSTLIRHEKAPIKYIPKESQVNMSTASGLGYMWQAIIPVDTALAEQLSTKKIMHVRLQSITKKISPKEGNQVMEFVSCMRRL